jgi:hypothetical protein
MGELDGRRILMTQAHLDAYGGSEIVTAEVAEWFAGHGAAVMVATFVADGPVAEQVGAIPGVEVVVMKPKDDDTDFGDLDLVWVHHSIVPESVLRSDVAVPMVFSHLSYSHPIEFPYASRLEAQAASLVYYASGEVRSRQAERRLDGRLDPSRIRIFGNPAPRRFRRAEPRIVPVRPRIAVVSNHIQPEIAEAVDLVRDRFDIDLIGSQTALGARPRRVDERVIHDLDAVITIGKTVQYALVAEVPVYCYDTFGGPGWLSPDNVEAAAANHFSGAGSEKRDAATIAAELVDGWEQARRDADALRPLAWHRFDLDSQLSETVLPLLQQERGPRLDDGLVDEYLAVQRIVARYVQRNRAMIPALAGARAAAARQEAARVADRERLAGERDVAMTDRDRLREERDRLREEGGRLREDRELIRQDRDRLRDEVRALRVSRDHEQARARTAEKAAAELRARLSSA